MENYGSSVTFPELQSMCMAAIKNVPVEQQDTVKFEVEKEETWYAYDPSATISAKFNMVYTRPETDEELAMRQAESDKRWEAGRMRDLAEYERLKKELS